MTPTLEEIEDFLYYAYENNINNQPVNMTNNKKINKNIHKKINKKMDTYKMNMLTKRIPFELDNVILKKSNIHGRGLFAKKNINKGELITFYPGDILEYYPNKDGHMDNHLTCFYPSEEYNKMYGNNRQKEIHLDYQFNISLEYAIFGHPSFDNDTNYMGHFINDGGKSDSSEKADKIYTFVSLNKANCYFHTLRGDLHVAVIASRDIIEGEELFVHYGIEYWKSYNKRYNNSIII